MRRTMLAAALVLVLAVPGAACSSDDGEDAAPGTTDPTTTGAPDAAPERDEAPLTVDAQLQLEIVDEGMTVERALLQFSLEVGPLPGVDIPDGERDEPASGTGAAAALAPYYDQLTDDQRAEVDQLLGWDDADAAPEDRDDLAVAALDGTSPPDASPPDASPPDDGGASTTEPDAPGAPDAPDGAAGTGTFAPAGAATARPVAFADPPSVAELLAESVAAHAELKARLGVQGPTYVEVAVNPAVTKEYAATTTWWHDNGSGPLPYAKDACHIEYYGPRMTGLDAQAIRSVAVHEMLHCFQQRWVGNEASVATAPDWVTEGQATWAMQRLAPTAGQLPTIQNRWFDYAMNPRFRLFTQTYEAVGFWGHLGDALGDQDAVWPRLLPSYGASAGYQHVAAFDTATKGVRDQVLGTWGSSYQRQATVSAWDMSGPGPVPDGGPEPVALTAGTGQTADLSLPAWTNEIAAISSDADIVQVTLSDGWARLADRAYGLDTPLSWGTTRSLCLRPGGCVCPAGTEAEDLVTTPAEAPLRLGLSAGPATGAAYAQGRSLDDFCRKPVEPHDPTGGSPDTGGGGGAGGGGGGGENGTGGKSTGDPHIATIDGRFYDLQTVGEYTLVRSTDGDLVVQTRQEPLEGSRTVSTNTALATQVDGTRVTVTMEDGAPVVRIDGAVDDELEPGASRALGDGRIAVEQTDTGVGYRIEHPDGSLVSAVAQGRWGLEVTVRPASARAGAVEGLLGNADGDPSNDLVLAGDDSGLALDQQRIIDEWGPRWRITQAESLFDYEDGADTTTFDDPTFPEEIVTADDVDGGPEAEQACRDGGITDEDLLAACTLDVALTGSPIFVNVHAAEEVRAAAVARRAVAQFGTLVLEGEVTEEAAMPTHAFGGLEGQLVVIGGDACEDSGLALSVTAPDGTSLVDQFACDAGRIELPETGTYTVTLNSLQDGTGPYLVPVQGVRPDRVADTAIGAVLIGTIDSPAAHDLWFFEAEAGQRVTIGPPDCDDGDGAIPVGLYGPDDGTITVAVGCDLPPTELPLDGTYQIVVNPNDDSPGSYVLPLRAG